MILINYVRDEKQYETHVTQFNYILCLFDSYHRKHEDLNKCPSISDICRLQRFKEHIYQDLIIVNKIPRF